MRELRETWRRLKLLLLSKVLDLRGARIFLALAALSLLLRIGWPQLLSEMRDAAFGQRDSLRNYVATASTDDLNGCRAADCTYETAAQDGPATLAFESSLVLPPAKSFTLPENELFVGLALRQTVPYVAEDGDRSLADIVPRVPPEGGANASPMARHTYAPPLQVASAGVVTALQPEDSTLPPLDLRGNLKAWAEFVGKSNPGVLRFSVIEFQPVPSEWHFAAPEEAIGVLNIGDAVELDFDAPGSPDQAPAKTFNGRITGVEHSGENNQLTVRPDGPSAKWLSDRIARELISIELKQPHPALPEHIHVTITPGFLHTGARKPLRQVPTPAFVPLPGSDPAQGQVWIIVENFLLPLQVRHHASLSTHELVEEVPLVGRLPVAYSTWTHLTPWQRARVMAFCEHGRKSLIADRKGVMILQPPAGLRAGAPARSADSVTSGEGG